MIAELDTFIPGEEVYTGKVIFKDVPSALIKPLEWLIETGDCFSDDIAIDCKELDIMELLKEDDSY